VGRSYSVKGYINAVLRRTSPTLLVEGTTDKDAMHRLLVERTPPTKRQCNIDHSAIFDDLSLSGKGAKVKVLEVANEVQRLIPQVNKLSTTFAYLVDREWDGLPGDLSSAVAIWSRPHQSLNGFVTIGHSMENYYFHPDCFLDYLRHGFAEHFSSEVEKLVRGHFPAAIALAGAFTSQAREVNYISRLTGLIGLAHIELSSNARFYLADIAMPSISNRCGIDASSFVANVNASIDSHWMTLSDNPSTRWVLHGHIGSEILWACVGLIAISAGVPVDIGEQIARGFQSEKRRCCLTWLSRNPQVEKEPLDLAADWLLPLQPADA
jgi:hypothetical protein